MEKKRFKMYKKGKNWVIAPIVFFGLLAVVGLANENNSAYADERDELPVQQVAEGIAGEETTPVEIVEEAGTDVVPTEEADVPPNLVQTPIIEGGDDIQTDDEQITPTTEEEKNDEQQITPEQADTAKTTDPQTEEVPTDNTLDSPVKEPETTEAASETTPTETTASSDSLKNTQTETATAQSKPTIERQTTQTSAKATTQTSAPAPRAAAARAVRIAIYRVYNPNSGEHLHTMNAGERDYLIRLGWRNEGISMHVDGTGYDLYRLYNPNSGEHFYTLTAKERDNLKRHGWRYEGIAWKTPKTGQPMYRVFNPNATGAGSHHYTMLVSERDHLIRVGWRNEGISWYTVGAAQPVASYALLNAPYINQNSAGFPMGCEAASLLQALQNKGYAKKYNLKSFIKEMPMSSNNNPNNGFSGKPDVIKPNIYHSIYAKPLAQWGTKYGKVADISGCSVETLKDELRKGNPVVVYVTGNYAPPRYGKYWWGTGIDNAHVVTLDGFNESNNTYHISDPNAGKYWISASKFEASYNLRRSAVVVR